MPKMEYRVEEQFAAPDGPQRLAVLQALLAGAGLPTHYPQEGGRDEGSDLLPAEPRG